MFWKVLVRMFRKVLGMFWKVLVEGSGRFWWNVPEGSGRFFGSSMMKL